MWVHWAQVLLIAKSRECVVGGHGHAAGGPATRLNLSDGFIGGGRKFFDGSGGSNGALDHFNAEKEKGNFYPLVVKLGTITAQGADVFSYAPDEDDLVKDPLLAQHLQHWGIDSMRMEKTDKSMAEMEADFNLSYDFSRSRWELFGGQP